MNKFVFVAPVLLAASASAPAQTTNLAAISAHLQAVQTMTATFAQTDRSGKTVNGVLTLRRPGKIRFQYEKGVPILIVADGKALTFIDYSVKQVQRWPIGNSPLGVLLDPKHDLARYARLIPTADARIVLLEAKDPKHPEYGIVTLAFNKAPSAPGGLMLAGWSQLDSQNNRTSVRLANQQFNGPVAANAFAWTDPRPKGRLK